MVLLGTYNLSSANGVCRGADRQGPNIEALNIPTLRSFFFNLCKACQLKAMASIPPSVFSAARIRETQRNRDMKLSNTDKGRNEQSKIFNTAFMELTPLKYNSKLMNSIWGFYNRYSPHNVKKINDAITFNVELQQYAANSTMKHPINKNEPMITLPAAKLDSMWAAINVSQSH